MRRLFKRAWSSDDGKLFVPLFGSEAIALVVVPLFLSGAVPDRITTTALWLCLPNLGVVVHSCRDLVSIPKRVSPPDPRP